MPRRIKPLTDVQVRTAKSQGKDYKLFDGGGLFLFVNTSGGKLWRLKYRFGGTEKLLSLGSYPEIPLTDARQRREDARKLLEKGIDPGAVKKAQKQAETEEKETFEVIAREWFSRFSSSWAKGHSSKIIRRLELDAFPWIGKRPINEIKAPELLTVLRRVEGRGAVDTAHRLRGNCGQIFRYAVATGRAERDPSKDLIGALSPAKEGHMAAITDPVKIGELLRAIDAYEGSFIVKQAMRLAPLVFVRPGELRKAEWTEIDLDGAIWSIPAERMKMKQAHIVPLSEQAVGILNEIKPLTGNSRYVFPSARTNARPMSDNAILAAFRRMGFPKEEMSGHGFRAMARTLLDEILHVRPDYIEAQLAHRVRDPNGRAYNRTAHLTERNKMMQLWADYLDGLKAGATVIPFKTMRGEP
jgi:integrase